MVGIVDVPSDKSIAHRAAIFSALADGTSRLVDYPTSHDPQSTLSCLAQLGVEVYEEDEILVIEGKGLHGLTSSSASLNCGNSGTTMRLLCGVLAGQTFSSTLAGDESLARRDMKRITDPLNTMGASIELSDNHSPIRIAGGQTLSGIHYELPVASAQVKSAVLLAGLYAQGESSVTEFARSRDHTERMLGLDIVEFENRRVITIEGGMGIKARTWSIPRDFSAAAYFIVAALLLPDSALRIPRVGLNPTRAGLLDVLIAMGARIYVEDERTVGGEAVGDLVVFSSELSGIELGGDAIPNIIAEIPILAIAATCAEGETIIRDAGELRHKESDRIQNLVDGLTSLGANIEELEDGMIIHGGTLSGGMVDSHGDHRIAMSFAIAGLTADHQVSIRNADCAAVSFPGFWEALAELAYAETSES